MSRKGKHIFDDLKFNIFDAYLWFLYKNLV